jgi:TonB family protein
MHMRSDQWNSPACPPWVRPRLVVPALLFLLAVASLAVAPARAERWICPDCPNEVVERERGADLVCPGCGTRHTVADMAPPVAYVNISTRDTELAWFPQADSCRIYRPDGVECIDETGAIWAPWTAVDWYIPRMRLLRLIDGREMKTDYAKDPVYCPSPPKFAYEVSDSLSLPGRPPSVFKDKGEYSLAELFIVAFSPEARDSARVRFIKEIEAGKHPRLPRTEPRVVQLPAVAAPPSAVKPDLKAEAVVEVRVHERRGIIGAHLLKSAGVAALDTAALQLAQRCSFSTAGELGVMVPSWVEVHVHFEGAGGNIEVTPARNGFWRRGTPRH